MKAHAITLINEDGSLGSLRIFLNKADANDHYEKLLETHSHGRVVWGKTEIEGFECYLETHYEVTAAIERAEDEALQDDENLFDGMGEKWIAAQRFTTEFEQLNQSREWDGEWLDELDEFMSDKIKEQYEKIDKK